MRSRNAVAEVALEDKRKKLVLAAVAGVLAGIAACGGQQGEPNAPGGPSATSSPSAHGDSGVGKEAHGCGQHDGGSCGAHDDDHKH